MHDRWYHALYASNIKYPLAIAYCNPEVIQCPKRDTLKIIIFWRDQNNPDDFFQRPRQERALDAPKPHQAGAGHEEDELWSVSLLNSGVIHEEGGYLYRLPGETVSQRVRPALPWHRSEQEVTTGNILSLISYHTSLLFN